MLTYLERKELVIVAGKKLANYETDSKILEVFQKASFKNSWFTLENIKKSCKAISEQFLVEPALDEWLKSYTIPDIGTPKKIGLILAGNIPFVGFHDVLTGFIAGHELQIKYSEKDEELIPLFIQLLIAENPAAGRYFTKRDRLNEIDAVIATGSDNSSRYFDYYFSKIPNLIRKNRTSIAVLSKETSRDELLALGHDIFEYFGLGCRSVSKLYIENGLKVETLMEAFEEWKEWVLHNKYKNNFDYNYAIYLLNKVKFLTNGSIIAFEDKSLHSRIACLHFEFFMDPKQLEIEILEQKEDLQVIVSNINFDNLRTGPFGSSQKPGLSDYADNIDTMEFLLKLHN